MKNSKPTWKEILAFAVGDGGCNLVWTTIGSYLTLYYTDSVGLAAAAIGTMMLLTRLLDGISDLIMEALSTVHIPNGEKQDRGSYGLQSQWDLDWF